MIVVLHGENLDSSYKRLSEILDENKDHEKVRLDAKSPQEDFAQQIHTKSLLETPKLIIIEGFLAAQRKPKYEIFENIPKEVKIVFFEKTSLTPAKVTKLTKFAKLEHFKLESKIFYFLDSIRPKNQRLIKDLFSLGDDQSGLLWQIENRLLLMILAKLNTSMDSASKITKRHIFDWQWRKIRDQASNFETDTLISLFKSSIKIDFLIKSGQTNQNERSLVSIMLLKYLAR